MSAVSLLLYPVFMPVNSKHQRKGVDAFTLVEIMVVVMILGLILAIAVPYYVNQRASAQSDMCVNNLLKIDDAACLFALEHGKRTGGSVVYPQDLTPYIKLNSANVIPSCPAGGNYSLIIIGTHPTCSLGSTVSPPHVLP